MNDRSPTAAPSSRRSGSPPTACGRCWLRLHAQRRAEPAGGRPHAGVLPATPAALRRDDVGRRSLPAAAVVLTTTCDQMRHAAAVLEQRGRAAGLPAERAARPGRPPAARRLYRDELRRLGRFLVRLGGQPPDAGRPAPR